MNIEMQLPDGMRLVTFAQALDALGMALYWETATRRVVVRPKC